MENKENIMYAIIRCGGKQYKAELGSTIEVDRLSQEEGSSFETDQVLLFQDDSQVLVGEPTVSGAVVKGTIVKQFKGKKIIVFKRKRRKGYRKKQGHRSLYTQIKIDAIELKSA